MSRAPAISTGWPALDAALGGGWPAGELSEIVGQGRCSLALAGVRAAQAEGRPVAWVDGPGVFCPPTAEVDLSALTLVRIGGAGLEAGTGPVSAPLDSRSAAAAAATPAPHPSRAAALLAAELLLTSRAFALLVLDAGERRGALAQWFRLARQARAATTALLLLGATDSTRAGSAAACTLRVSLQHAEGPTWAPLADPRLSVQILRLRGASGGTCLHAGGD